MNAKLEQQGNGEGQEGDTNNNFNPKYWHERQQNRNQRMQVTDNNREVNTLIRQVSTQATRVNELTRKANA